MKKYYFFIKKYYFSLYIYVDPSHIYSFARSFDKKFILAYIKQAIVDFYLYYINQLTRNPYKFYFKHLWISNLVYFCTAFLYLFTHSHPSNNLMVAVDPKRRAIHLDGEIYNYTNINLSLN